MKRTYNVEIIPIPNQLRNFYLSFITIDISELSAVARSCNRNYAFSVGDESRQRSYNIIQWLF